MNREDALREEAVLLGRYLIGETPHQDVVERYVGACGILFPGADILEPPPNRSMHSVDAHDAVANPGSPLRQRLFVMTALLEASPHHTSHFLATGHTRLRFVVELLRLGFRVAPSYLAARLAGRR